MKEKVLGYALFLIFAIALFTFAALTVFRPFIVNQVNKVDDNVPEITVGAAVVEIERAERL
jgi:Mg2+/citrate symporter